MQKHKLSAWLDEKLGSHEIVVPEIFRKHLLGVTGCDADWRTLEKRMGTNKV
jgi:hypothetical protein